MRNPFLKRRARGAGVTRRIERPMVAVEGRAVEAADPELHLAHQQLAFMPVC
jgi:hypothetical protein